MTSRTASLVPSDALSQSGNDPAILRKTFQEAFTLDVIKHVIGPTEVGMAGGLGAWEYSEPDYEGDPVQGSLLWDGFVSDHADQYYIINADKTLARKAAIVLPRLIQQPVALAYLGIGDSAVFQEKDLTLTQKFEEVTSAHVFDINNRYVNAALPVLQAAWPKTRMTGGNVVDLFSTTAPRANKPEANFWFPGNGSSSKTKGRLATMFGGTLVNIAGAVDEGAPEAQVIERLKMIRRSLGKGGFFVVTQDSNEDPDKITTAYANQTEFACNLAHRINRDTPYNVHPERTLFEVVWHPQSLVLAHYLTFNGEGLENPINKRIHFNNSYKIPNDIFLSWVQKAKFESIHSEEENGVYLHVLEAT